MKFIKHLPKEIQELLENQYKEYIKNTPMTKKEQRVLHEWVKDGHSVYENNSGVWDDGQVPVEFLTVYREEEYIRQKTKGMSPEDTRKFAMTYYGWDDEESGQECDSTEMIESHSIKTGITRESDLELPFD